MAKVSKRDLRPAVVLVADRTLSARYRVLFEGIFATMQTTAAPEAAMRWLVSPRMPTDEAGRAWAAPLGLRRMEAALLANGWGEEEVVVTTPERLPKLLGPWVQAVGVSSSDPLGRGMSNTTTRCFWKGELYTKAWTDRMMGQIRAGKERWGFAVLGGGAGAWQWVGAPEDAERQGLDTIVDGYGEGVGVAAVRAACQGRRGRGAPEVVREAGCAGEAIRPIRGASLMGVVELSRGCGRGCRFCTMAGKKMHHLPAETIVADLETNVGAGMTSVVSGSEDFFRYGGDGAGVKFEALRGVLKAMRSVRGLSFMQIDHANVTSVAQMTEEQLLEVRRLLRWERPTRYLWVNLGVESANGRLVAASGAGKVAPYRAEDWEELAREAVAKLERTGYFPVVSLVLGLPGEAAADVARTMRLVEWLEGRRAAVFPIFYEPVRADERAAGVGFDLGRMRADHLALYERCYEINFRQIPGLFWDNQRAGGVGWAKRVLMRLLGKTEVRAWRGRFRQLRKEMAQKGVNQAGNATQDQRGGRKADGPSAAQHRTLGVKRGAKEEAVGVGREA